MARIEVAEGTALRLKVTNADAQRHDLKVEDGPSTPMLAKGDTRVLDLGQVTENREAWCTLPAAEATAGSPVSPPLLATSTRGSRSGTASARQCRQARGQARVDSQITMKGRSPTSCRRRRTAWVNGAHRADLPSALGLCPAALESGLTRRAAGR